MFSQFLSEVDRVLYNMDNRQINYSNSNNNRRSREDSLPGRVKALKVSHKKLHQDGNHLILKLQKPLNAEDGFVRVVF